MKFSRHMQLFIASSQLPAGLLFKQLKRGRLVIMFAPYKNAAPNKKYIRLWGYNKYDRKRLELR